MMKDMPWPLLTSSNDYAAYNFLMVVLSVFRYSSRLRLAFEIAQAVPDDITVLMMKAGW